ncbi:MazG-like family protein [Streptomyces sp. NPDC045456]|uniref:MazG-like family protein n=1 Tax=Streptomyces sp. NPDC045456 TaxID=3155254 RepID=UPI0033F3EDC4
MDSWATVSQLVEHYDERVPAEISPDLARQLRIDKITEEVGEVAEACQGIHGTNPRKGRSHTVEHLQKELADVILTSMVALRTMTPEAKKYFETYLAEKAEEVLTG